MNIGGVLLRVIILFLPAYFANAAPVIFHRVGVLKSLWRPLDLGKFWRGKRVLGDHKTFAGLLSGVIGGSVGNLFLFILLVWFIPGVLNWDNIYIALYVGAWLGLGAIVGDVIKSFFKRRLNIASGKPWFFFDQVDFIFGAWIFSGVFASLLETWPYFLIALLITPPLHFLANVIAYKLGWKKVWW